MASDLKTPPERDITLAERLMQEVTKYVRESHVFDWIRPRPTKPPCQSCSNFIFCAISEVRQCPMLKRPSRIRRFLSWLLRK